MWIWHVPALYEAALKHAFIHVLEHLTLRRRRAAVLVAPAVADPLAAAARRPRPGALHGVTKILVGFLGILLAFSPEVLYYFYEAGGTRWGLTALDDQHVAGLIMALEQSIVMGIALAYLFVRMLAESEEEDQRAERYGAA